MFERRRWGGVLFAVGLACSASSDGPTRSTSEQVVGACGQTSLACGVTGSCSAPQDNLGVPTSLIVPTTIALSNGATDLAGATMQVLLSFDGGSSGTCIYQRTTTDTPSDLDPLPLQGCDHGLIAGGPVTATTIDMSGSLNPSNAGRFYATANVSYDIDDGKPCTNDICTNGVISHPPIAVNTPVSTGEDTCTYGPRVL